jgi:hypothetical protein
MGFISLYYFKNEFENYQEYSYINVLNNFDNTIYLISSSFQKLKINCTIFYFNFLNNFIYFNNLLVGNYYFLNNDKIWIANLYFQNNNYNFLYENQKIIINHKNPYLDCITNINKIWIKKLLNLKKNILYLLIK